MSSYDAYYEYLQTRRWTGALYRRWWLYPRLCRRLSGQVLDVGCGLGDMLQFRPQTVGVDVNPRTVAWCQSLGLDARLMQPDMLPFPDVTFDGILLDNVLEHLKEPRLILAEMRRVLKPSGGLLIGVPGRRGFSSDPDHKVFYTEEALVRLLTAAGFQQEKLFFMPFKSAWLERRMRQYCLYGFFRRI